MQYSSPQSYCLFMLISYPHGPHKHNMVNHIGHIICILYLYIYIYIYIILFLAYYYTPYGDINDIILMGYLSILFCSAQEMENEPRREDTAMQDVEVADGRWIGCGYGIWQRLKTRPLYICIYIYMHMQWSIIRQCWLAYCSTCSVFVRTIFVAIFMNVYQQFGVGLGCRCCRNEWLFSVCTSRLRIEFQASLNFV